MVAQIALFEGVQIVCPVSLARPAYGRFLRLPAVVSKVEANRMDAERLRVGCRLSNFPSRVSPGRYWCATPRHEETQVTVNAADHRAWLLGCLVAWLCHHWCLRRSASGFLANMMSQHVILTCVRALERSKRWSVLLSQV